MTVLLAGFDGLDTERISVQLRESGFSVVGASGRESARTLAQGTSAGMVVVPDGDPGDQAWGWIADLIPGARVVSVGSTESAGQLIERLRQVSAVLETQSVATPSASEAPMTALPGLPTGLTVESFAPPAIPEPGASPVAASNLQGTPDLTAKLDAVRFGDYHQILEIEVGATAYVIDEQHERLVTLYSPTGWPGPVSARDVPLLEEAQRGIREAYEVLGDGALREMYEEAQQGSTPHTTWSSR